MRRRVGQTWWELCEGNIAEQDTDAVVNAAQSDLKGGQGVDAAVHTLGGPEILAECRRIGGCPVGCAVITSSGRLPSRFVIHAVGPSFDTSHDQAEMLALAYLNSLRLAVAYGLSSISFPAISTGAFGYPLHEAAAIAVDTIYEFLTRRPHNLELVRVVLYPAEQPRALSVFRSTLEQCLARAQPA